MMSLEQTTTPTLTVIIGEASKEGGSTVTIAPTTRQEQPVDGGQPSYATMSTQNTLIQAPQLAVRPSSTTPPMVEDTNATPIFFQQLPPNQVSGIQLVVFQTPPPPNQMAGAQPVVFQTPPPAKSDGRRTTGSFPDTIDKPDGRGTSDVLPNTTDNPNGGRNTSGYPNATAGPYSEKLNSGLPNTPIHNKHSSPLRNLTLSTCAQ
ncbi:unnamed protein product [Lactuca saligna]|uniref:Uncharacterized protein n=1 Tax=Lactuca saligna TaxID=75948 RepID=A0AA36ECB3_LACSI|nr:unnamed protein product [Lactuca saligna]